MSEGVRADKTIMNWLAGEFSRCESKGGTEFLSSEFTNRCASALDIMGDKALNTENPDDALAAYSTALLLSPSNQNAVLMKWTRTTLISGSASEALLAAAKVRVP